MTSNASTLAQQQGTTAAGAGHTGKMPSSSDPFLTVVLNLSQFHREHEKFYAESPLREAVALSRSSSAPGPG